MPISFSRVRLSRAGIFLLLAMLVALLGAAAKHSQFETSYQHGYLSKAVKMSGARIDPGFRQESAPQLATPAVVMVQDRGVTRIASTSPEFAVIPTSFVSPPLRV